jgi:hypothetical protein
MNTLSRYVGVVMIVGLFLAPLSAYALGVPFGGIVDAESPCHVGPVPALWINVLGFSFVDVLAPPPVGTLPFLYGVPIVGQFILGLADTPIVCSIGLVPLPPGLRVQMFGTSPTP